MEQNKKETLRKENHQNEIILGIKDLRELRRTGGFMMIITQRSKDKRITWS